MAVPSSVSSADVRQLSWQSNHRPSMEAVWKELEEARPVIIQGALGDWEASNWTPAAFAGACGRLEVVARVGRRSEGQIPREAECFHHRCTMGELCRWLQTPLEDNDRPDADGSEASELVTLSPERFFAYLDYKYFHEIFSAFPAMRDRAVDWRRFGPLTSSSKPSDSVLWMGSAGAATPLHQDAYGSNLVAQLQGAKEWTLFPPGCSETLRPTRVPYEESSVYSRLSAAEVDAHSEAIRVTLHPGEVLHVPRHWWHQVRCLETAISVNLWVPHPADPEARVEEAMVKAVLATVSAAHVQTTVLGSNRSAEAQACETAALQPGQQISDDPLTWLNPNEDQVYVGESLETLGAALAAARASSAWTCSTQDTRDGTAEEPGKRQRVCQEGLCPEHPGGEVSCRMLFEALTHPEVLQVAVRALRSLQAPL